MFVYMVDDVSYVIELTVAGKEMDFVAWLKMAITLVFILDLLAAVAEQTTAGEAVDLMMDAVEMAVERMVKMHTLKT
jgi:geranylgeranyl pyrophosphate synthase